MPDNLTDPWNEDDELETSEKEVVDDEEDDELSNLLEEEDDESDFEPGEYDDIDE
jgi:hypothetical protein